jgi:hypothetical protein
MVSQALTARGIPHALVGGMALAAHGLARATLDADVLAVAPDALDRDLWDQIGHAGADLEIRYGEPDDPFRAVVRVSEPGSPPVDVLVGRFEWQRDVLARSMRVFLPDLSIPVVRAADLILLKLFAGGPQDLVDVQRLLSGPESAAIARDVESRLTALPATCRRDWERIRGGPRAR